MVRRLLQSPLDRTVVEAYRLDRYDNFNFFFSQSTVFVVEAYRLDRYDNPFIEDIVNSKLSCRSLSFG